MAAGGRFCPTSTSLWAYLFESKTDVAELFLDSGADINVSEGVKRNLIETSLKNPSHPCNAMDIKEFLKPNLSKILIALVLPALIGLVLTFSVSGVFAVYGMLLAPGYTVYGDVVSYEWNMYILGWVPIYAAACALAPLIESRLNQS